MDNPSMTGEDDMSPMPKTQSQPGKMADSKMDEPDSSPIPSDTKDHLDVGKGKLDPNSTLKDLGAGSPYQGWY